MDSEDLLKQKHFFIDFETNKKGDIFLIGVEVDEIYTCYFHA